MPKQVSRYIHSVCCVFRDLLIYLQYILHDAVRHQGGQGDGESKKLNPKKTVWIDRSLGKSHWCVIMNRTMK